MKTLSIIIPAYNESKTIRQIVQKVEAVNFGEVKKEIIIVDDGSTDGTREIIGQELGKIHKVVLHGRNMGKGAAIRTALGRAEGDYIVIQDADLELEPADLKRMLDAMIGGRHEIVYGSRILGRDYKQVPLSIYNFGGLFVTWWTNLLYGTHLSDEATGYKMFTRKVLDSIKLESCGFEFCPEFTGKAVNAGFEIVEIPVSYKPRSSSEGKKLRIKDGFIAIWTLLKIKVLKKT